MAELSLNYREGRPGGDLIMLHCSKMRRGHGVPAMLLRPRVAAIWFLRRP